jgi:tight adherence protein B
MVEMAGPWVLALLIFAAVGMATVAAAVMLEWLASRSRRKMLAEKLQKLANESLESLAPGASGLLRRGESPDAAWVRALSARLPHLRDVQQLLEQAALEWTVQTYLMLVTGMGLSFGLSIYLATGGALYGLAAGVAGGALPYFWVRFKRTRRLKAFEERFPEAIDQLGRGLRAGYPFSAGIKMVADESREPIATEFRRIFEEQRFGIPLEDTLTALADRVPLADVRIFVTALLIQREVGGNLVEILDNLAGIIRQRFTLQRQVQVLTAEGRISAYVLGALPIGTGLVFFLMNPEYMMPLFTHPLGHMMVGGALIWQTIGFLWMKHLTHVEF